MNRWILLFVLAFLSAGLQAQKPGTWTQVKNTRHTPMLKQHLPIYQSMNQDLKVVGQPTIPQLKKAAVKDPSTMNLNDSIYEFEWDSVKSAWPTQASSRWLYTYDNEGRKTREIMSRMDRSGKWSNIRRSSAFYNSSGDETVRLYDDWDTLNNDWIYYERDSLVYNAQHRLLSEKWYFYNRVTQTWFLGQYYSYNDAGFELDYFTLYWDPITYELSDGYRLTSTPDANNHPLTDIYQNYNASTSTWQNSVENVYVYIQDTLLSMQTTSIWTGSVWQNNYRSRYTYNESGLKDQQFEEHWDTSVSAWVVDSRTTCTYQAGLLSVVLQEKWDQATSLWINIIRTTYSYQGNLISVGLEETWNNDLKLWSNFQRKSYTYQNNLPSVELQQSWDHVNLVWVNSSRISFYYYPDSQPKEILVQEWITQWKDVSRMVFNNGGYVTEFWIKYFSFGMRFLHEYDQNNYILSSVSQEWDTLAADWRNKLKDIYYYSLLTEISNPTTQAALCAFANPYLAGSVIRCSMLNPAGKYQISLYNMAGYCMYKQRISGESFSIDKLLPEGLYLLTIYSGNELIYLQKIIMQQRKP